MTIMASPLTSASKSLNNVRLFMAFMSIAIVQKGFRREQDCRAEDCRAEDCRAELVGGRTVERSSYARVGL